MPQRSPSHKQTSNLPRSRPSIHRSRDAHDKSDIQERSTMSRNDPSILTTSESSFKHDEVSNDRIDSSELLETSNNESEDDEQNSETCNYNDREDSLDDSRDDYQQHCRPTIIPESAPFPSMRNRIKDTNFEAPKYANESVFTKNFTSDTNRSNTDDPTQQLNAHSNKNSIINLIKSYPLLSFLFGLFCILFCCVIATISPTPPSEETFDIKLIKEKFFTQDEYLWIAFESGVNDVVKLNRPSTFILLYEKEAEGTATDLLYELSKYAVCNITDCSKEPIEISSAELNSSEVTTDYGILIENYRDTLREKGVMIIKNLEMVPGISAQAFHSICDEFTPLVDRSLIIFTMKVDKLPSSKDRMKFVEQYFRNKWTDIKVDTFNALITRITSMVIEIRA